VRGAHHPLRTTLRPADTVGRQRLWRMSYDLLDRLETVPGVTSVATGTAPLRSRGGYFPVQFTETGDGPRDDTFTTGLNWVSPDYFEMMGIPLIRGEGLPEWDRINDWDRYWWATLCNDRIRPYCKALVSETFAEEVWPGEDPIGKELGIYGCCWTVAGVVGDVRNKPLDQWWSTRDRFNPDMQVYINGDDAYLLRAAGDPLSLTGAVRDAIGEVDPEAVVEFDTLEQLAYDSLVRPRFFFLMFGLFAGVGLLMSLVGLYGVIAFTVGRRTQEIGVRMALGAARLDVRAMVVRQGMAPVFLGLLVGLILATSTVNVLEGFLYETPPLDPWIMAGVGTLLALVSALACWAPASRASAVDPVKALVYE
jgi:putative ABC transport system permease protein